jgi:hypothetical protein
LEKHALAVHSQWQDITGDDLSLPVARDWLAYWRELGGRPGRPPERAALNMPAQRPALCQLALWVQLLGDDDDYLIRLTGEEVRRRFGARLAGCRLSELPLGDGARDVRRCYDAACSARAPVCARGYYDFGRGPDTRWEACFMPFVDGGTQVTHLLVGAAYA